MRLNRIAPVLAVSLALAACNSSSDEDLNEEALSMEDVAGEVSAAGFVPSPGEYRTSVELLDMSAAGFTSEQLSALRPAFEEGAAMGSTTCVGEEMTAEEWVSQMQDNECSILRYTEDGGQIDMAITCTAEEGPQGTIEMAGTASETGADMEMRYSQDVPTIGEMALRMRVQSERIGDCG